MVYFDILGFTFISYSELMGQILNIVIPILSVIVSYYILHDKNVSSCHVFVECLSTICSLLLSGLLCYLIAIGLDFSGKTMSWYNHTYYSIALYGFPTLAVASVFYAIPLHTRCFLSNSPLTLALQTQARLNGVNLVWAVGSIILTILGYRSAYVLMMPVLVTLIVNAIIGLTKSQNTSEFLMYFDLFKYNFIVFFHLFTVRWLYIHLTGQVLVVLWTTHLYHAITAVFIPTAGRSGSDENPDILIGFISCFFTMFIGSYLVHNESFMNDYFLNAQLNFILHE